MRIALALARRGVGNAWPNPAVGCVLVGGQTIVGRGWTQPGGRPHAETEALARAGARAKGATAYVTLEPCAHHGRTPPCADALIDAGISRVVVALEDPDPRVDGGGIARLRAAGIETVVGVGEAEAEKLNAGFLTRVTRNRPLVTLKVATTLDGRIATRTGESQWITGEAARAEAHALRARHDAILVGAGTARTDDPSLTCRLPGLEARSPIRVFVDGAKALPATHHLIADADRHATIAFTTAARAAKRRKAYTGNGGEVEVVDADDAGGVELGQVLVRLAERGVTRLLVEGGAGIASGLLRLGLVDRLIWFRAPSVIGGDGLPAALAIDADTLDKAAGFKLISVRRVGEDLMEHYEIAK